jgi:hypothetical protein
MKVSRRWIEWAHGPGAEDGQPLAMSLCDLASAPGAGSIEIADPTLIAELVDVAGLYVNPRRGDALHDMGLWWMGQPRRVISEGRAALLCGTVQIEWRRARAESYPEACPPSPEVSNETVKP